MNMYEVTESLRMAIDVVRIENRKHHAPLSLENSSPRALSLISWHIVHYLLQYADLFLPIVGDGDVPPNWIASAESPTCRSGSPGGSPESGDGECGPEAPVFTIALVSTLSTGGRHNPVTSGIFVLRSEVRRLALLTLRVW